MKTIAKYVGGVVLAVGVLVYAGRVFSYAWDTEHNIAVDKGRIAPCTFADTCNGGVYRAGRWDYITGDYGHYNTNWKESK